MRLFSLLIILGLLAGQQPSAAQSGATIRQVIRVVKTARRGSAQLIDAQVGATLNAGDRIRTGGRSFAGLRFPDNSVIRVGQLSEVTVTNPRSKRLQVTRGQLFGQFTRPAVVSGGYAVAAVRGTNIEYIVSDDGKSAEVRCYEGRVFVSDNENPVAASVAVDLTASSMRDPELEGSETNYTGGELRFVDGPLSGQTREVTNFDAATGTVTFRPAIDLQAARAGGIPNGYLISQKRGRSIVELRENEGTVVGLGRAPSAPKKVPGQKFAGLQAKPFFQAVDEAPAAGAPAPFNGSATHQTVQQDTVGEREATQIAARATAVDGGLEECLDFGPDRVRPMRKNNRLQGMLAAQVRQGAQPGAPSGGTTPEQRILPALAGLPATAEASDRFALRLEPFGVLSNDTDVLGGRLRAIGSQGDAYFELGYRYALINGRSSHELSEAFLTLRGKLGDLTVGRQHLFLRLANNTNIGALLGLETTDGVTWRLPLKKGYEQSFGYIWDTTPLASGILVNGAGSSFHTFFARGRAPVFRGNAGYSVMLPTESGLDVGWSLDAAQAIIKDRLEIYGELGRDPQSRDLSTVGLYVPALYHAAGIDLFLEYHRREAVDEVFTVRLRREVVKNLLLVAFADRRPGDNFSYGGAVLYSIEFK